MGETPYTSLERPSILSGGLLFGKKPNIQPYPAPEVKHTAT